MGEPLKGPLKPEPDGVKDAIQRGEIVVYCPHNWPPTIFLPISIFNRLAHQIAKSAEKIYGELPDFKILSWQNSFSFSLPQLKHGNDWRPEKVRNVILAELGLPIIEIRPELVAPPQLQVQLELVERKRKRKRKRKPVLPIAVPEPKPTPAPPKRSSNFSVSFSKDYARIKIPAGYVDQLGKIFVYDLASRVYGDEAWDNFCNKRRTSLWEKISGFYILKLPPKLSEEKDDPIRRFIELIVTEHRRR